MELSQLASFVDSTPIEMLRRAQLWQIADRHNIQYPRDATKKQMIDLLEAMQVDVTQPENGIQWMQITGEDENGRSTSYVAPVIPAHQSARDGFDSGAVLDQRIQLEEAQEKNDAQADELKRLREENAEYKAKFEDMSDKLDALLAAQSRPEQTDDEVDEKPDEPEPDDNASDAEIECSEYSFWELFRIARDRGLEPKRGMKRSALEALINGENTT